MGLFGWLDSTPSPAPPVGPPAPAPDPFAALLADRLKNSQPSTLQRILGGIGGGLSDYAAFRQGRPATGISDYFGGLKAHQDALLSSAAQNQALDTLGQTDASKPIPSDALLQIARLKSLGVDTSGIDSFVSARNANAPKFTYTTLGGQPYKIDQFGNTTPIGVPAPIPMGPGQGLFQPPGAAGADATASGQVPPSGQPTAAAAPPTGDQVASLITTQWPGMMVKSGLRTPEQNAAVDGVPNSAHLSDTPQKWARDFHIPPNVSGADAAAQINAQGVPGLKALYEGPGANNSTAPHLHVQYIDPGMTGAQPAPPGGGHWIREPSAIWRDPTPAELDQHPGVSQVNTATGELKYTPQSSIPPDPKTIETTAKGIANYQLAPLTGFVLKTPWGQATQARVMALNPGYQGEEFPARSAAYKAFKTGKQGDTVRAFNVAISHLDTLRGLASALDNGNVQIINQAAQAIAQQTGKPAPTNFDAAKEIVGDEVVKAIVGAGGGGALADRTAIKDTISRAASNGQLTGAINTYTDLMAGQLSGTRKQYETSTGRKDFNNLLFPETIQRLEARDKTKSAGSAPSGVVRVKSPADAAKLKPGTKFMTPDGRVLVRQ